MNQMKPIPPVYLGDSVYCRFDGENIILTTENGLGPSNTIFLHPDVLASFLLYVEKATNQISEGTDR